MYDWEGLVIQGCGGDLKEWVDGVNQMLEQEGILPNGNRLGGFLHESVTEKPNCALIGEDGNIFNLMGIAVRTLRENGLDDQGEEMEKRITGGECRNYYEALNVIDQYVTITGKEEPKFSGIKME